MKATFITLFILTNSGNIMSEKHEIFENECTNWFSQNVAIDDNKRKNGNKTYYVYNDKKIIGYICSSELR